MVTINPLSTERRGQLLLPGRGHEHRLHSAGGGRGEDTTVKRSIDPGRGVQPDLDRTLRSAGKVYECDEIWSFCCSKAKNVPIKHEGEFGFGDVHLDRDRRRHEARPVEVFRPARATATATCCRPRCLHMRRQRSVSMDRQRSVRMTGRVLAPWPRGSHSHSSWEGGASAGGAIRHLRHRP